VLATLIAIALVDRLGRRNLPPAGLTGMAIRLVVVGIVFQFMGTAFVGATESATAAPNGAGMITLLATMGFVSCMAFRWGRAPGR
jgi:hypothetical protein